MNNTKAVKCCSNDGRILIPKHMRDALDLRDGEPMILRMDGPRLILEKYRELETLDSLCTLYLRVFGKSCDSPTVITNTEHVLATNGIALPSSARLSGTLTAHIQNAPPSTFEGEDQPDLFGDGRYRVNTLVPIRQKDVPVGAVILLQRRNIPAAEQLCARLLADIVSETLSHQEEENR